MMRMASFRRSFWEEEVGGKVDSGGMGVREQERPFADWQLPCDTDGGRGCCSYRGREREKSRVTAHLACIAG